MAVIASRETAALYGLQILERKINRSSHNVTRFAVFSRSCKAPHVSDNQFAMFFTVKNEAGSLLRAVEAIGEHGFNLRTLKSRPTRESNWEYYFYVEGEGSIASPEGERMLAALRLVCGRLQLLGSFDAIHTLKDPTDPHSAEATADAMLDECLAADGTQA